MHKSAGRTEFLTHQKFFDHTKSVAEFELIVTSLYDAADFASYSEADHFRLFL